MCLPKTAALDLPMTIPETSVVAIAVSVVTVTMAVLSVKVAKAVIVAKAAMVAMVAIVTMLPMHITYPWLISIKKLGEHHAMQRKHPDYGNVERVDRQQVR